MESPSAGVGPPGVPEGRAASASPPGTERRPLLLVGEAEQGAAAGLRRLLAEEPIDLLSCGEAAKALLLLGRAGPDAVLLGSMEGPLDAMEFLRIARTSEQSLPIVVGVPVGDSAYALRARGLGATFTVERPYRADELRSVLRFLLREWGRDPRGGTVIDLGRLRVDGEAPEFRLDGVLVPLPPTEYLLLRHLARNAGAVVSRQELVRAAWAGDSAVRSNTLNVHIMRLRRRLGDDRARPRWISTVHGIGYRLTVPEKERGEDAVERANG
ncbi:DNA-binding response OmpR family regulator [Nocardiopsis sp. Huas11]|uniref:response regulator transcription factor n=1 Tax=Nocardiopsis sp. Huas11 TaxID=2183912 RepID=UPI000F2B0F6C|nr:response regulator transcription factor [Nocardiopsis sp. Huas11]RKS06341.1 DNA-binding response OmpR family regulator [Nocardiopsis sp. Huas11]